MPGIMAIDRSSANRPRSCCKQQCPERWHRAFACSAVAPTREQILAASAGWVAIVLSVLPGLLALAGVIATEADLAVKKVR